MVSTYLPCITYSVILIIFALPLLMVGFVMGDGYKRVLDIDQRFFFWIGRDRVVFNMGLTFKVVGAMILGLGLLGLYLGVTATAPH